MKTKQEIQEWFFCIYDKIILTISNNKLIYLDNTYSNPETELTDDNRILLKDIALINFYLVNEWWKVFWKSKPDNEIKYEGSINFMPLEQVLYHWDEEFGGNSWSPEMKGFKPLDMFYESAGCVGFFIDREDKKGLYLYKFDGETQALDIDFEGYLKLLGMSKGYGWWQNSLIEIATGISQPNVKAFKEEMPKIFTNFSWDEFCELYESLRLSKK